MSSIQSSLPQTLHTKPLAPQILLTGLGIGESPRWHDGRLWFCNWGMQEVIAVDLTGKSEVIARVSTSLPFSIDWLPDGRLLLVSGREGLLLRIDADESFVTHADLNDVLKGTWNEVVVDGRGNIYVNGGNAIALVASEGAVQQVADAIEFPNGMAITPDNATLIIAESHGRRLTAFNIAADGRLSNRRVWADLDGGCPDGICIDSEGAVWYADVPNKRCVRVREGGQILASVPLDRGCFACALGGVDRKTLFMMATEWHGFEKMADGFGSGQILTMNVAVPGAGWP